VSIIAAATEQEDDHDNEQDQSHGALPIRSPLVVENDWKTAIVAPAQTGRTGAVTEKAPPVRAGQS
jgi:hypothetical protein